MLVTKAHAKIANTEYELLQTGPRTFICMRHDQVLDETKHTKLKARNYKAARSLYLAMLKRAAKVHIKNKARI